MASRALDSVAVTAAEVARGVSRLLYRSGIVTLAEVPLGNGRRADLVGLAADGRLTLVEIKVSLGDLRGDAKWPTYLDYCDRFFWAVPPTFPHHCLDAAEFVPDRTGVILADAWDGYEVRCARQVPLHAARRKAETLRFARVAVNRLMLASDSGAGAEQLTAR